VDTSTRVLEINSLCRLRPLLLVASISLLYGTAFVWKGKDSLLFSLKPSIERSGLIALIFQCNLPEVEVVEQERSRKPHFCCSDYFISYLAWRFVSLFRNAADKIVGSRFGRAEAGFFQRGKPSRKRNRKRHAFAVSRRRRPGSVGRGDRRGGRSRQPEPDRREEVGGLPAGLAAVAALPLRCDRRTLSSCAIRRVTAHQWCLRLSDSACWTDVTHDEKGSFRCLLAGRSLAWKVQRHLTSVWYFITKMPKLQHVPRPSEF